MLVMDYAYTSEKVNVKKSHTSRDEGLKKSADWSGVIEGLGKVVWRREEGVDKLNECVRKEVENVAKRKSG